MEGVDGKKQRRAHSAAERAIRALADGDPVTARRAARKALDLDQVGMFPHFVEAVHAAAGHLDAGEPVPPMAWDLVAQAAGPGPLSILVEELKAEGGIAPG